MDKTWLLPIFATVGFNVVALAITYVLFKKLKSTAEVEGGATRQRIKAWKATGALAGFIIIMLLQVGLLKWLIPKPEQPYPESYRAVLDFYTSLQAKTYSNAWGRLAPAFQASVWSNSYSKFEAGYRNTRSINLLAISLATKQSDFVHDYVVYFQDETRAPSLGNFRSIAEWKLTRLPELLSIVSNVRSDMVRLSLPPEALDNLMIAQFISGKRADKLRWYLETRYGVVDSRGLFGDDRKVTSVVGLIVRVEKSGKNWLIGGIDGLPFDRED